MAKAVLTEIHGEEIGLDDDRALVIKSGIIRSKDGSPVSFPDGQPLAGTLAATSGGTGQSAYSAGDLLYALNGTTLLRRTIGAAGQVLSVTSGFPAWAYPGSVVNSQSADYTLALTDQGGRVYHPAADTSARTWTIPANSSVAVPIGTAITIINDTSAGALTIAITSDTLVFAGTGSTGSRTLAANGDATLLKIGATRWRINGTGLT
jgi:hypothetical protein